LFLARDRMELVSIYEDDKKARSSFPSSSG
jgi:hypothetical protein